MYRSLAGNAAGNAVQYIRDDAVDGGFAWVCKIRSMSSSKAHTDDCGSVTYVIMLALG
jgi:hypothetical protein